MEEERATVRDLEAFVAYEGRASTEEGMSVEEFMASLDALDRAVALVGDE